MVYQRSCCLYRTRSCLFGTGGGSKDNLVDPQDTNATTEKALEPYEYPTRPATLARTVGAKKLLISGGRILTATGTNFAEGYIAIEKGQIMALGAGKGPIEAYQNDSSLVIAADGMTVTPGLIDTHSHFGPDVELLAGRNIIFCDCGNPGLTTGK